MINPPNSASYQQRLTSLVVALRDAFQNVQNANDYITAAGGVTFLENSMGMTPEDSAVVVSTFANLGALATAYNGGSAPVLNYKENSNLLWAGQ